jgi:hypothetical protein
MHYKKWGVTRCHSCRYVSLGPQSQHYESEYKSSKNGDQSILHPNHYSIHGLLNLIFKLLVNLIGFNKKNLLELEPMFQSHFRILKTKFIVPLLGVCDKTHGINLELQIPRFAFHKKI